MKEIEITVSLRNNRLKERRLKLGMTQRELAACVGISMFSYTRLEVMSRDVSPFNKRTWGDQTAGDWTAVVKKIAAFYDVDPSELFPNAVITARINKAIRKIDSDDIPVLLSGSCDNVLPAESQQLNPEEQVAFRESIGWYTKLALPKLTEKEVIVLKLRFDKDLTFGEIAKGSNKSVERIRQIQTSALDKFRRLNEVEKINEDLSQDK